MKLNSSPATENPQAVDAVFDSGFSNGYLALNAADLSALGWHLLQPDVELTHRSESSAIPRRFCGGERMTTANGLSRFDIYQGKVIGTPVMNCRSTDD